VQRTYDDGVMLDKSHVSVRKMVIFGLSKVRRTWLHANIVI
jgi:hypothetical protein